MISNFDYIKKVLTQIQDSYNLINNLKDEEGDLEIIKKELLKINGFFNVLLKKIGSEDFQLKDLTDLKPKLKNYLDNYYFVQEIDTMSTLYSGDSARVKNMRLKILEAFEDRKLINTIELVRDKL